MPFQDAPGIPAVNLNLYVVLSYPLPDVVYPCLCGANRFAAYRKAGQTVSGRIRPS